MVKGRRAAVCNSGKDRCVEGADLAKGLGAASSLLSKGSAFRGRRQGGMGKREGSSRCETSRRTTTRRGLASLASIMAGARTFKRAWLVACGVCLRVVIGV